MKLVSMIAAGLAVATLATPAFAEPAMWEVSDSDSKVWLFGSVHALPADLDWRTALFDEKLQLADKVYFEADVGPLGQIALGAKMTALLAEGPGEPWLDRLSYEQRDQLAAGLAGSGVGLAQAATMPPWLIVVLLESQLMVNAGYEVDTGVDLALQYELAKERKGYFETAVQQIELMAGASTDEEVATLLAELQGLSEGPGVLGEMVASWAEGDVESLATIVAADPMLGIDAFGDTLLYDRNRNWIPAIESLLSTNEQDLIIVGAAHLAGDGSVIDLLEKAGYTVSRIQ